MKRFLIFTATGVVLYLLYEAYTKPKQQTPPKTPTKKTTVTQTYRYETGGTGGQDGGGGTGGGTNPTVLEIFSYSENYTGRLVRFCSHSLVARPVNIVGEDIGNANSFLEYEVKNSNGNTVVYCKNTRSGLHTNYSNQFNHNTHLSQFAKPLPVGSYTITIKNISVEPVRQKIQFGLIRNNCEDQINEDLLTGQVITRNIQIFDDSSDFKLICDSWQNY